MSEPLTEETPKVPPGTPPAEPDAPKLGLTQEQIDVITNSLPPWLKPWVPVILIVAPILFGSMGFLGSYFTGNVSKDAIYLGAKLDEISKKMDMPLPSPATPVPTPIPAPTTAQVKVLLTSADADLGKSIADLHIKTVTVDPTTYPAGSTYLFSGNSIPLPCMVVSQNGVTTDVKTITVATDVTTIKKGN